MSARQWKQLWVRTRATLGRLQRRLEGWRAARRALRELELGRTPDGGTVVLDYHSGQLLTKRSGRAMAAVQQVVSFEYADLAWLERVIAMGGYAVRLDDDGDLAVRTPAGLVFVRRYENEAILHFFMRVIDDVDVLTDEIEDMVNVLNLNTVQGRWVQNNEGALFMSYDLYAGVGITSAQVLASVRACAHEVATTVASLGFDRNTT